MKVSGYDSNYIQQTTCGPLIKKILERDYNKGKIYHKLYFKFNFNFPEKKLSKIKSNKKTLCVVTIAIICSNLASL